MSELRGDLMNLIYVYVQILNNTATLVHVDLLNEAMKIREGLFDLPRGQRSLTKDDLNFIIKFLCTA